MGHRRARGGRKVIATVGSIRSISLYSPYLEQERTVFNLNVIPVPLFQKIVIIL